MRNCILRLTPYALFLTVLAGCGYHLAGSNRLPSNIRTIAVPVFYNETFEPSVENTITTAVKQEFLTNSRLAVVNDPEEADLVLKGKIVSFGLTPLTFDRSKSVVLEYRVRIRVEVAIENRRTQKVLWKDAGMESSAEYAINPDTAANRVAQDHAIAEAGKQFAEDVVHRVLEGF
ncbi:MAG: LptE family protein [Nitrospirae bacterium]|nr:LptE family protein [Nitrospirota bacterium]